MRVTLLSADDAEALEDEFSEGLFASALSPTEAALCPVCWTPIGAHTREGYAACQAEYAEALGVPLRLAA
jgi:hypothetical protein